MPGGAAGPPIACVGIAGPAVGAIALCGGMPPEPTGYCGAGPGANIVAAFGEIGGGYDGGCGLPAYGGGCDGGCGFAAYGGGCDAGCGFAYGGCGFAYGGWFGGFCEPERGRLSSAITSFAE